MVQNCRGQALKVYAHSIWNAFPQSAECLKEASRQRVSLTAPLPPISFVEFSNLPLFRAKTLVAQAEQSLIKERLLATLSSCFGALSLQLACIGLYGLMPYAVARRITEIGIRLALGARCDQVMWLVLRETLSLALAGIAVGVPMALWTATSAKSL